MRATPEPGQPQGLVGGGLGAWRPGATPPQPRLVTSGPSQVPLLSVHVDGRCTLNKALLSQANLRGGSPVLLVVPPQPNGAWYLDTQPKPGAGNRLPSHGRACFKVPGLYRNHFRRLQVQLAPADGLTRGRAIVANENSVVPLLHFQLGEQVEGHPGYYRLVRVRPASGPVNH